MMKTLNTDYDDDGQFLEIHDYFHFDLFLSKQLNNKHPAVGMSTRSCYLYLLLEKMVQPHCICKFSFTFGPLN